MTPLYIFDLDGTLALIEHRRHFVENGRRQWREFFAACVDDEPNLPVIRTLESLTRAGADVWIWSGRSDAVIQATIEWLQSNIRTCLNLRDGFRMRKAGDYRPDDILKAEWLDATNTEDISRLVAVFDDRDRLVKMYRDRGIACFQVAPGAF